ncbi:glycosyltransferase family 1 protein [Nocardioides humilatus]|uniref:Glycosyltransferase family 1 protein n=1 Tax=Nocardioides humilatus TaxID=2607660 RepID=A0A5B1LL54_9ACTN|nr:glycosyltransferase [Nocardioides humilatus]KAA1421166.1 glycosyltransferase family 1 protein [Nocardioides humilatus]
MRIALVTETFYPAVDSTTTTMKATADRLVDLGHTVRIIAPGPGLATYRGCDVVRVRPLEPGGAQIRSAIEAFEPDLVQATSPRLVGRKALKHAKRSGIPTLVVEQSPILDLAADYWRAKVADRADTLLVTAPWMVGRVAELGAEATLWEPGVDTRAFNPTLRDPWLQDAWSKARAKDGRHVVVGYVGSLDKRHGVRRLAELADLRGIRLVVIGDGPEREWLEKRLQGARFTGPLTTGDLTVALPTLDVLVHPGELETDCHALREAAASGVPTVAPRAGGAADVVRHLETGVLYDPSDARDLRRAVAAVVGDRHRGLLGDAARVRALRRTWVDAVDELVARHYPVPAPLAA